MRIAIYVLLNAVVVSAILGLRSEESGTLTLSIVDDESGMPVPARVELLDGAGKPFLADDALAVGWDGGVGAQSKGPWQGTLEEWRRGFYKEVPNPFTKTTQFYIVGASRFSLAPGTYRLRAFKGVEYRVQNHEIKIEEGKTAELVVRMSRWIDMPKRGWYGSDAHLHIARPFKEVDPDLSKWMQAEDLHVANLLQWGHSYHFYNTIQYAHGGAGVYQEGNHLLAPGQENPRTYFLGHAIVLGAPEPIHFADDYLSYGRVFRKAREEKAVAGYAHAAKGRSGFPNPLGLAIDLPGGMIDFIEVLQYKKGAYHFWYDALNLGFRIAPVAGTDYMKPGGTLPGRDRFYTRVDGPLTYSAWLEGIRRGRTFVTNGPMLEFEVDGKGIGDEVVLKAPSSVRVAGRVRFNPEWDDVKQVEILKNGAVERSVERGNAPGEIPFQFELEAKESIWLALRVSGLKVGEIPGIRSEAHSGAIYLTLEGAPRISVQYKGKSVADLWMERLDELEKLLAEENLPKLAAPERHDGVTEETLRKSRAKLLESIRSARAFYGQPAR